MYVRRYCVLKKRLFVAGSDTRKTILEIVRDRKRHLAARVIVQTRTHSPVPYSDAMHVLR